MKLIYALLTLVAFTSCAGSKTKTEENNTKSKEQSAAIYVDTMHLQRQTFNKQIVCNGKLRAVTKSEIAFPTSGTISAINIKNGDRVSKCVLLSLLDTLEATIELQKAQRSMEKAQLDLTDKLIGQGYGADSVEVPEAIMNNAKHSSGYNTAVDDLQASERALEACYIYAPFSGRVANVEAKAYDAVGDVALCTLIDDTYFDVEFFILEAELEEVAMGQKVSVSPFIDDDRTFAGQITEINPLIDDNGQIKVRARVANSGNYLMEGMNVKLVLNREIQGQYVVPKDAVVLRDGFHVIFRYEGGEAVWTYVTVEMSNIDSHLITGHADKGTELSDSDVIIISGNRNLADGVRVNIK